MDVAILGGTGDIGEGLALRWGKHTDHTIRIGSRSEDRAEESASAYGSAVPEGTYVGLENPDAARGADLVVLSVPPYHVESTVESVADGLEVGTVVVTPAVGLKKGDSGFEYHAPPAGSVTQLVAKAVPDRCSVVGCLHNVPADPLADLDVSLDLDTPLVADDPTAAETAETLIEAIPGIDVVRAGGVTNASEAESLVALLLNVETHTDGASDLSIRLTPASRKNARVP